MMSAGGRADDAMSNQIITLRSSIQICIEPLKIYIITTCSSSKNTSRSRDVMSTTTIMSD